MASVPLAYRDTAPACEFCRYESPQGFAEAVSVSEAKKYYTSANEAEGTLLADLRHLQPYGSKVVRCRKQVDVEEFFLQISAETYICR